jgi:hypothetical protein|tara:strand:- start:4699 stop:4977 length:279 start_codon:yes stop_codon:yes gene_type:complete
LGNKLDTIDNLIVDIEKQMWEIREVMEHTTSINRETPMNQLKDMADEFLYNNTDGRGDIIMYYGWLEALSWVMEDIKNLKRDENLQEEFRRD